MLGKEIGIQWYVRVDSFETRDDASKRAHVLAEARNCGSRRDSPVSAACHDHLGTWTKLKRGRRTVRVVEVLAAAGWTLRAASDVVSFNGGSRQIEANNVVVQIRPEVGGNRFRDFGGCELNRALSERVVSQR